MAKNMIKKSLFKAGSTVAVAMAMTSVISMQAHATEVGGNLPADIPPVETSTEANAAVVNEVVEPVVVNETIDQSNTETAAENTETAENNQQIEQNNNTAIESNVETSGGELADPGLELPEAPVTPDTEGTNAGEYNEIVGEYNEEVDGYNEAVDGYNEGVDEYNSAADEYDQQAQEQYDEDKAAFDEAKTEHEEAEKQYEEDLKQYQEDSQAYQDYLNDLEQYQEDKEAYDEAKAAYDTEKTQYDADSQAYQDYLNDLEQYQEDKEAYDAAKAAYDAQKAQYDADSQAYQDYLAAKDAYDAAYQDYLTKKDAYDKEYEQYKADSDAYQDYLDKKDAYEDAKAEHDEKVEAYETEDLIYDEVTEYNEMVEEKNDDIADKNAVLEEDLHADTVDEIDDVGEINENVVVDAAILEILNNHDELTKAQADLEAKAAALDADERKNASLGSEDYAAYLAEVEAYNEAVAVHNQNVADYNDAVSKYNAAVDTYNANQEPITDSSTDGTYEQGTADWGNINIKDHTAGHLDVKYNAAVSKDAEIQPDGTTIYKDSVTKYEIDGVYTDSESTDSYALNYLDSESGEFETQSLKKENYEFRIAEEIQGGRGGARQQMQGNSISIDPMTGKVSFYMTVVDENNETQGLTVNLDASSTYADGTYFKPEDGDNLQYFVDSNGKKLPTVIIDGETYYDISGQSVFVISSLACNGAKASYNGSTKAYTVNPDGLDLVLNLQTLIKIHQEDNAQKITYMGYQLGKTAQATAPTDPGEFPGTEPTPMDPPTPPVEPIFNGTEPTPVNDPGEAPVAPNAPEAPIPVNDPGEAPVAPNAPEAPTPVNDPGEAPVAPTAPEAPTPVNDPGKAPDGPGEFTQTAPEAPVPAVRLNHVGHLDKLAEKLVVVIPTDIDPIDPPAPDPMPTALIDFFDVDDDGLTEILDEEVPLAKAPKTGDASMLFGAMSLFSMGGMLMLKKKKKD